MIKKITKCLLVTLRTNRLHQNYYSSALMKKVENKKVTTVNSPQNFATYEDIKAATQNSSIVIIDVRRPDEIRETGKIPSSVNIPLNDLEQALKLPEKTFLERYRIKKPDEKTQIIFSCHSGTRSAKAHSLALKMGYKNAQAYSGGWSEWKERSSK